MMRLMMAEKEQLQDAVQLVMKLWPGHEEAEMLECVQEYVEHEEKTVLLAKEEGLYWGICLVSLRHDYVEATLKMYKVQEHLALVYKAQFYAH